MSVCGRSFGCERFFIEPIGAQVQVLPCVRPTGAAVRGTAGLYGDRGSVPHRFCALEALGHFTGCPDPVFGPLRHTSLLTFLPP